jgi:hypothetical protein
MRIFRCTTLRRREYSLPRRRAYSLHDAPRRDFCDAERRTRNVAKRKVNPEKVRIQASATILLDYARIRPGPMVISWLYF